MTLPDIKPVLIIDNTGNDEISSINIMYFITVHFYY